MNQYDFTTTVTLIVFCLLIAALVFGLYSMGVRMGAW